MPARTRRTARLQAAPLAVAWLLGIAPAAAAQDTGDGIDLLIGRLQQSIAAGDESAFRALFDPGVPDDSRARHASEIFSPGAIRRVSREMERVPLANTSAIIARRVVMEMFEEWPGHARVQTTGVTLRRPPDGGPEAWRITEVEPLGTVEGLYRLRFDTARQFAADNLRITAPDLRLTLESGAVFLIDSDEGVSGVVLIGRGEMAFTPAPETERGQLRLLADADALVTPFESALVRFNPSDYPLRVPAGALRPVAVDRDLSRRAAAVADRELPKSLIVDLREVSPDPWYLLPRIDDMVADVRTRRHGTLTYSRFGAQPEDVSLIDRERRLTIALYPSADKLAVQGRSWDDEALREYDVLDYAIEAAISPQRRFMTARARMTLRALTPLTTLMLRLADPLVVTGVTSAEKGPLSHLRLRHQNAVMVRLPGGLAQDETLTLTLSYSGLITSQALHSDALQFAPDLIGPEPEPHLLLSSASFWYPQNPLGDRATATMRLIVPRDHGCVASGEPIADDVRASGAFGPAPDERALVFRADRPIRYLAVVVSRLRNVHQETVTTGTGAAGGSVAVSIEAQPLQVARARELVRPTADILRFYASLLGDPPFPSLSIAAVEANLPGGHSPAYLVLLNTPVTLPASLSWQNDPASFTGFPEFFLAHELAHQWWGQAVGTKNYHERWISEGFAQYLAALYAQRSRGDRLFRDMLRQFRRWSLAESRMGPVFLGHRLGQLQGGPRVFRALVYNKGAAVLHMLRRVVGDEIFFHGLREFYGAHRFGAAGTDDLQRIFEAAAGRSLDRFFAGWILGSEIPRVRDRSRVVDGQLRIHLEQLSESVFELPVTATIVYDDGETSDIAVVMSDRILERPLDTDRRVRSVQFNRDFAALAEFVN